MNNLEKIIHFFNRKYNFEIEKAPKNEQKAYSNLLARWDNLKVKRDRLKYAEFKKKVCMKTTFPPEPAQDFNAWSQYIFSQINNLKK